jgi:hypothetical protein
MSASAAPSSSKRAVSKMERHRVVGSGAATQDVVRYAPPTSTGPLRAEDVTEAVARPRLRRREEQEKQIENAVYAHIKAVRALGRTEVNTAEICKALRLPLKEVEQAASRLASKGVKVA